jgi:uncharacterized protein (DUF2141 family)
LLLCLFGALLPAIAAGAKSFSITCIVTIPAGGMLYVTVVDSTSPSLKSPGFVREKRPHASAATDTVVFKAVPSGTYAVRAFLDTNNNDNLDMGMMGPKEPTAASWNGSSSFIPTFEATRFRLRGDTTLVLRLK